MLRILITILNQFKLQPYLLLDSTVEKKISLCQWKIIFSQKKILHSVKKNLTNIQIMRKTLGLQIDQNIMVNRN